MLTSLAKLTRLAALTTVALAATAVAASAAITVTKAEISAGQLVVKGSRTGTAPNIVLDDTFSTGVVSGAFAFSLTYLPPDCIVDLKSDGGTGGTISAVVANCGPRGLSARGAWSNVTDYLENDVVTDGGSSYRAKRTNTGKTPATSGNDWEVLAAKGARGIQGATGLTGSAGSVGAAGPAGPAGTIGSQGPAGATGAAGPQGTSGIVASAFASANVNQLGATTLPDSINEFIFVGATVNVTVADGQTVFADGQVALGTTAAGGATLDRLAICYQFLSVVDGTLIINELMTGLKMAQNQRLPFAMSRKVTGLFPPGPYKFGMCYQSVAGQGAQWNSNDLSLMRAFVTN